MATRSTGVACPARIAKCSSGMVPHLGPDDTTPIGSYSGPDLGDLLTGRADESHGPQKLPLHKFEVGVEWHQHLVRLAIEAFGELVVGVTPTLAHRPVGLRSGDSLIDEGTSLARPARPMGLQYANKPR
jgi:hypothetical protein